MIVEQFICRKDNLATLVHDKTSRKTIAIDAPDGKIIHEKLKKGDRILNYIFVTHFHSDHTEGILFLKSQTPTCVVGSWLERDKISGLDHAVQDGEIIDVGFCKILALATPGHTDGSFSYYLEENKSLFTGDTLFSLGCGRLFEGSASVMYTSLQKLVSLPYNTCVYSGHEYTENNGYFALTVDSKNHFLSSRMTKITSLRKQGKLPILSTLKQEKATNPFLRCSDYNIRKHLQMLNASDEEVFAELRSRKDIF